MAHAASIRASRQPERPVCRTQPYGPDGEGVQALPYESEMPSQPSLPNQPDLFHRIADILCERYEPFGANRVALRIIECIRAGDRINDLVVVTQPRTDLVRYYLHQVQTYGTVHDLEGNEHPNLEAARFEAVYAARELMASAVRVGRDISGWAIEIADDRNAVLARVPFGSVIEVDRAMPGANEDSRTSGRPLHRGSSCGVDWPSAR